MHVEFANNVAGSDVMRQTLDGHWTAKQAVQHQLELGHILTLNADNLQNDNRYAVYAFLRRGLRRGFCPTDVSTFEELIDSQDEQLFDAILQTRTTFSINYFLLFPMRLKDTYYAPVHITDSYQITRLTFVSRLILLIDYCAKTLTENVFIAL